MTYPALARALEYALRSGAEIPKPLLDSACKALGIPRRDRLEPGRLEKEKAEDRIAAVIKRRFNRQKARVRQHLEMYHPYRKDINHTDEELQSWLEDNPEDGDDATRIAILLSKAARGGVKLFDMNVDLGGEFALTNTEAAKWAATYVYDLIRGIDQTTLEAMRNAISTFVSTPGYTIGDVMDLLPFNSERARRVAVTEITRAYAEGNQLAAGALAEQFPGVRVIKRWYTNQDDRVCEVCGPLGDQEPIDHDESWTTVDGDELENPPAHVNCVLPGNEVVAPGSIVNATKAFYKGIVVEITLMSGRKISITENHPIFRNDLTWVLAKHINQGDDLVTCSDPKRVLQFIDPDMNYRPVVIEEIFESLAHKGRSIRFPVSSSDFHGDGKFINGDINVVSKDGFLWSGFNPPLGKHISNTNLVRRSMGNSLLSGQSTFHPLLGASYSSSGSLVSSVSLNRSLNIGHVRPLDQFSFASPTRINAIDDKVPSDRGSIDTKLARQFVFRFSSEIESDKVVKVRNYDYSGHVYNLQVEPYGLYFCNYTMVSNCRCWTSYSTDIEG